jgi:hypothetical protein
MEFYKLTVMAHSEDDRSRDACIAWAVPAADALLAELQKGELEKYPTAFAYEAVCKARDKWQGRAEAAEARVAELDTRLHKLNIEYGRVTDGWSAASTNEQRLQARVKEQDGIIEARNKSLGDAEARVRDLTTQVEALNHLDEDTAEEYREWRARAERAEAQLKDAEAIPANWLGVSEKLREYETRLAAIDAAKAGEPPIPDEFFGGAGEDPDRVLERRTAWGRQGWDAAAALRVELTRSQGMDSARERTIKSLWDVLDPENDMTPDDIVKVAQDRMSNIAELRAKLSEEQEGSRGAIQAMSWQCTRAHEEGRLEERERIATLLDGEADNDLVLRDISRNHKSDLFGDDLRAALETPTKEEK